MVITLLKMVAICEKLAGTALIENRTQNNAGLELEAIISSLF